MIFRRKEPCGTIFISGVAAVFGKRFTIGSGVPCAFRKDAIRNPAPRSSTAVSVKATRTTGSRGYDAGKKINGRKRHLLVDTLGLLLFVVVHVASVQDRDGAKLVLRACRDRLPRLQLLWADGGYAGQLIAWTEQTCHWKLEIVKRSDKAEGFTVLPRRWVVERTISWVNNDRRLSKDYECWPETSEAIIHLSMINVMLKRLTSQPLTEAARRQLAV